MNETYTLSMSPAVADFRCATSDFFSLFYHRVNALAVLPDFLANLTAQFKLYFPYGMLNELLGMI